MSGSRNSINSTTGVQESNRLRLTRGTLGGCQAYTESGAQCQESRSLRIIDEIQQLYEDRLRRIDDEAGGDGTQLKLKTLTAWVNDLGEQNSMLVQTVEQLEQEASDRVALLEEQLQRSSRTALGYMTKLQDYDHQMNEATGEKVQLESTSLVSSKLAMAQQTEEALRARVCNLQSDIGGLLELIRRARQDGSWEIDGLNFCEVTYEDIFGCSSPYQGKSGMMSESDLMCRRKRVAELQETFRNIQQGLQKTWQQLQESPELNSKPRDGDLSELCRRLTGPDDLTFLCIRKETDELLCNLELRDKKIENQNCIIESLQTRLKVVNEEMKQLQEQSCDYMSKVPSIQRNQEESERRINELQVGLESAKLDMQKYLQCIEESAKTKDIYQMLCRVKDYHTKAEEGQAAFNNMKAELDYLLHNLTAREKQIRQLETTVADLQDSLKQSQDELDNAHTSAVHYLKGKDSVARLQRKYEHNLEELKKAFIAAEKEKHELVSKLCQPKEREMESTVPETVKRHGNLLKEDNTTAELLLKELDDFMSDLGKQKQGKSTSKLEEEICQLKRELKKCQEDCARICAEKGRLEAYSSESADKYLSEIKSLKQTLEDGENARYSPSAPQEEDLRTMQQSLKDALKECERACERNLKGMSLQGRSSEENENEIRQLKQDLENCRNECEELRKSNLNGMTLQGRTSEENENEIQQLKKCLENCQKECEELRKSKLKCKEENQNLQRLLEEAREECKEARKEDTKQQANNEEVGLRTERRKCSSITTQEEHVGSLHEPLSTQNRTRCGWKRKLEESQKELGQHEYSDLKVKAIEEELKTAKEELQKCQNQGHLPQVSFKSSKGPMAGITEYCSYDEKANQYIDLLKNEVERLFNELKTRDEQESGGQLTDSDHEHKIKILEEELNASEAEIKMYRDKILRPQMESSGASIESKQSEVVDSVQYRSKDAEANKTIDNLKRDVRSFKEELQHRDIEINKLGEANTTLRKELIHLQESMQSLKNDVKLQKPTESVTEHKATNLKKKSIRSKEEDPSIKNELQDLKKQMNLQEAQHRMTVHISERRISNLEEDLKAANSKLALNRAQQPQIATLENAYKDLLGTVDDKQDSSQELRQSRVQFCDQVDQVAALRMELACAQGQLNVMKNEMKLRMASDSSVQKVLKGRTSQAMALVDYKDKDEEVNKSIASLKEEICKLMDELQICDNWIVKLGASNTNLLDELDKALGTVKDLKRKAIFKKTRDLDSTHKTIEALEMELREIKADIQVYQERLLHPKMASKTSTISTIKSQVADSISHPGGNPRASEFIGSLKKEIDDLLKELHIRHFQIATHEDTNAALIHELDNIRDKIKELEEHAGQFEEEIASTSSAINPRRSKVADSIEYHGKDKEAIRNITSLKTEVDNLLEQLHNRDIEVANLGTANATLKDELANTKNELLGVKKQLNILQDVTQSTRGPSSDHRSSETEDELRNQIKMYQQQLQAAGQDNQASSLQEELMRTQEELRVLKKEMTLQKAEGQALKDSSRDVMGLETEEELRNQIKMYQKQLQAAGRDEQVLLLEKELAHTQAELRALKKEMKLLESQPPTTRGDDTDQRIKTLEGDLKAAEAEIALYRDKVMKPQIPTKPVTKPRRSEVADSIDYRGKDKEAGKIITSLKKEVDNLLEECHCSDVEKASIESENTSLRSELVNMQDEIRAVKRDSRLLRAERNVSNDDSETEEKRKTDSQGSISGDPNSKRSIKELKKELKTAKNEIKEYQEKCRCGIMEVLQLAAEISPIQGAKSVSEKSDFHDKDEFNHTIITLKTEMARLQEELQVQFTEVSGLETKNKALSHKLANSQSEIQNLKRESKSLQSKTSVGSNSNLDLKLKAMEDALKDAEQELATYKEKSPQQSSKQREEVEAYTKKNEDLQSLVDKLTLEVKALKSTIAAQEKVDNDQKEMLTIQQDSVATTQNELKELRNKLAKAERLSADKNKADEDQKLTIANLKQQLEELQGKGAFEDQTKRLQIKNDQMRKQLKTFDDGECTFKETNSTDVDFIECENCQDNDFNNGRNQIEAQKSREEEEGKLRAQLEAMKEQLKVAEGKAKDNAANSARISAREEEEGKLRAQLEAMKEQLKVAEGKAKENSANSARISAREEEEGKLRAQLEAMKEQLKAAESKAKNNAANSSCTCEVEALKEQLKAATCKAATYSTRCFELETLLNSQYFLNNQAEDAIQTLKKKLNEALQRSDQMETELAMLKMQFQKKLGMSEKRICCANNELEACKNALTSMKDKGEHLKNLLKEKSEEQGVCDCEYEALKVEMEELTNDYETLADQTKEEIDDLKMRLQDAEDRADNAEADYRRVSEEAERHQNRLLDSANRELRLQQDYSEKEKYMMGKVHQAQIDNVKVTDLVDVMSREIQALKTELSEREGQLQGTAARLQCVSCDSKRLQKEIEAKDNMIQKLQCGISNVNMKMFRTIQCVEEKDAIIQDLKKDIAQLQSSEDECVENVSSEELAAMKDEVCHLKCEVESLQDALQKQKTLVNSLTAERDALIEAIRKERHINVTLTKALCKSRRQELEERERPESESVEWIWCAAERDVPQESTTSTTSEMGSWCSQKIRAPHSRSQSQSMDRTPHQVTRYWWVNEMDKEMQKSNEKWKRRLHELSHYSEGNECECMHTGYQSTYGK